MRPSLELLVLAMAALRRSGQRQHDVGAERLVLPQAAVPGLDRGKPGALDRELVIAIACRADGNVAHGEAVAGDEAAPGKVVVEPPPDAAEASGRRLDRRMVALRLGRAH